MKTNQILTRKMGDFNVNQRTSDGMFNATELLKQWNEQDNSKKEISKFFENQNTKSFLEVLEKEEILHTQNFAYVKSKASRGKNVGTWMHPYLFIKFAMWLNPKFEYQVIKFVYDELIKYRHDAGDNYILLTKAIAKIVSKPFLHVAIQNIARAINHIVFNTHYSGIRNAEASEETLRNLSNLEFKLSELINEGFITDYDQTISYLRKQWNNKYQPKLLNISA
jgi:hypothetical protein